MLYSKSKYLPTQLKGGEKLVAMFSAVKKGFNILGDEFFEMATENMILKRKETDIDQKWLIESGEKFLKKVSNEKNLTQSWV